MGRIRSAEPVLPFVGMLAATPGRLDAAVPALEELLGAPARRGPDMPWDFTDYYAQELGPSLLRRFVFFSETIPPARLASIKVQTNRIEEALARRHASGRLLRTVNLDPGYLAASKVVLATTKDYGHRVYLGHGIYAEVTLVFRRGRFRALEHTYPDYRSDEVRELFAEARRDLLLSRRS